MRARRIQPFQSYMILWAGQALSLVGSQSVQFALIWHLTQRTGSATTLATAAFIGLAPQVALGPLIGALVDRWSRKRVMLLSDGFVAVASLVLAWLFYRGTDSVTAIFAALLCRSLGTAFHAPAMLATASLMVPPQHLTRIQGLHQMLQGALGIVAAPLGALLVAALPMSGVMVTDAVTAVFAIVPLLALSIPRPVAGASPLSVYAQIAAGIRYLRARPGHMSLVGMAAAINLCLVPAFSLLPLHVMEELHGDALRLGYMSSTLGVGLVAGGMVLGVWGGFRKRIVTTLSGLVALGLAVMALGAAPASPIGLAFAAIFAVGLIVPTVNGPIQAILQATVAPEFQGRVFTLMGTLAGGTAPVGLLMAAPIADLAGVRSWYLLGGAICLAMGIAGFLLPVLLEIEKASGDERERAIGVQ